MGRINFQGSLGPMMNTMLDVLQNGSGFNKYSEEQYTELYKALTNNRKAAGSGQLMKALAKSSTGYPTQAQNATSASGSEMAPLVPQSLDPKLVSATVGREHVKLYNMLTKPAVFNTVHEIMRLQQGGLNDDMHAAFPEGGAPIALTNVYARDIGQVKFLGRKFNLTDVSRMVGVGGWDGRVANRGALKLETENALVGLGAQIERHLFHDDTALWTGPAAVTQAIGIDGLYKQIAGQGVAAASWFNAGLPHHTPDGDNYYDNRGAALDHSDLITKAIGMTADPTFARPNMIWVGPKAYAKFYTQALSYQRTSGGPLTFGPTGQLQITAGPDGGRIPIINMPLLPHKQTPRTTALGDPKDISGYSITPARSAGSSDSKFEAGDVGAYIYKIVAVGAKGKGAALTLSAVSTTAAGDKITIDVPDSGDQGNGTNETLYYEVYRSDKDGAAATCKFMYKYPTNQDGAGGGTRIVDENKHIPGCSPAYIVQFDPNVMYMPTLLPMMRRPLPSVDTTAVMLIMTFTYLHVKMPTKVFCIDNCLEAS